ncbi:MAG: type II toxin-antitoxin system prevent-host-death family antitoxin [Deltaproteobacteria bacterium]|nr:type II toxin-antitoxin system prevent-host-death family antitoxin [Deltaproteobacteria bacterium]
MEREREIGLRELKARLSAVVAGVRRGRSVVVTVHGRRVARVVPVPDAERPLEERLVELESAGLIGPAAPAGSLPPPLRAGPAGLAQRLLAEDRAS